METAAPAKVNLTLRVLGKRSDGYHDLASLVAFADCGDILALEPGGPLSISVQGPFATEAGPGESNLVLKAAHFLANEVKNLRTGKFLLTKNLPAGAGLGGGSSDAAAALRLLAQLNSIGADDPRLIASARATGADVPVCLDPRARIMQGKGDVLSPPIQIWPLAAVLVFPGKPLATGPVFANLKLPADPAATFSAGEVPVSGTALLEFLKRDRNDLEIPAISLLPAIGEALRSLAETTPELVRMSGSGSTVFAIYSSMQAAGHAASRIQSNQPDWWVQATTLR